ncbi:hypothetical protein [Amycolatopsis sp. DSM 110486]|uniref:hypothetical protein n=1 Tax=Amycolatopsis sp. DSM 110486 TaxID=2865832 RepID=UPI001C6A560D|nr:hypothetical protein [Amycolatopsis sp. DSM 110486]QYN18864.1 hypothetical protein K1T34_40140 [Amycolatopsis sp. DSM 110486]
MVQTVDKTLQSTGNEHRQLADPVIDIAPHRLEGSPVTEEVPVLTEVPAVATPQGRSRPVSLVIAAAIGLAIGAAGVGIPWLLTAHDSGVVSGLPLKAPDTLGGVDRADVQPVKLKDDFAHRQFAQRNATNDRENTTRVSAAYGAPAVVQTYTAVNFSHSFTLTAIRTHAPGLAIAYEDKDNGLAAPTNELRQVGDVSCVLRNNLTPLDEKLTPDKTSVFLCQRTDPGFTIQLKPLGDDTKEYRDPTVCAAMIDEAWTKLH